MNSANTAVQLDRSGRGEPGPGREPAPPSRPSRRTSGPAHGALLQPVLHVVATLIAAALTLTATGNTVAAWSGEHTPAIAGAEQMRRQALAVQAFRDGHVALAYGRFAALADAGDGGAALQALAMARHGTALYGSEWSVTEGQLRRWRKAALDDLRRHGTQIAMHDRGE